MYQRVEIKILKKRLQDEPRRFIQVLAGPRQVGKTTLVNQFLESEDINAHYVAADTAAVSGVSWVSQQWEVARLKYRQSDNRPFLLVIDEIQKAQNWSEAVKKEWDDDSRNKVDIRLLILGSSRLMLQQGLTESLAGRYEMTYLTHWTFEEMRDAFGFSLEDYIWFGGFPGAAIFLNDETRWRNYVSDSLIESSISKDILMLTRIDKPALLRRLFELGCEYSGQILSYTKILGQLQDAGNTTTLAHYLKLLDSACLLGGIEKFSMTKDRQRASSPKFHVYNNAFKSAQHLLEKSQVLESPKLWGRWVESAVGAHLLNLRMKHNMNLYYWRQRDDEVDFVIEYKGKRVAVEVKSGAEGATKGMTAFQKLFSPNKVLLVGNQGIEVEDFLLAKVDDWI